MNHKRGRCKNRRGGCLMCKPWKVNGAKSNLFDTQTKRNEQEARLAMKGVGE